ncbi:MAG TPA: AraC family transcriptional regulator [Bacteroidaceae bacterium]|nr:AraC family transcriptional regulator [Bacteroidaceae bacterium]
MVSPSHTFDNVHLTSNEQIRLHQQPTWELSYIIIGSGMRLIGNTTEPFSSGEVVLIPPDIPHCWYFDNQNTDSQGRIANITITFENALLQRCLEAFPELEFALSQIMQRKDAVMFGQERAKNIIDLLKEMCDLNAAERVAHLIRLFLLIGAKEDEQVIGRYKKMDTKQRRLEQIKIYIACNADREIMLDTIAKHVGMNRAAFCVFFKKATGKTFVNFLNEYRVKQACQMLERHEKSVSEICYLVGFNNVSYFNRVFKRMKGVSPIEYRKINPVD